MCQSHSESPTHLFFHCSYVSHFWHIVLEAFDWSLDCSNNMFDILASLLVGHPFNGTKKTVGLVGHYNFGLHGASAINIFLEFFLFFSF